MYRVHWYCPLYEQCQKFSLSFMLLFLCLWPDQMEWGHHSQLSWHLRHLQILWKKRLMKLNMTSVTVISCFVMFWTCKHFFHFVQRILRIDTCSYSRGITISMFLVQCTCIYLKVVQSDWRCFLRIATSDKFWIGAVLHCRATGWVKTAPTSTKDGKCKNNSQNDEKHASYHQGHWLCDFPKLYRNKFSLSQLCLDVHEADNPVNERHV